LSRGRPPTKPAGDCAFAEALIQMREDYGISQAELARALGITQGRMSLIERGHHPMPFNRFHLLRKAFPPGGHYPDPLFTLAKAYLKSRPVISLPVFDDGRSEYLAAVLSRYDLLTPAQWYALATYVLEAKDV
jgi:transcriptional regulator with XRE-family HTH domain